MPEKVDRLLRVNRLIQKELAAEIEKIPPPAPNMLISVTGVSCSVDLHNAAVGISIFGGTEPQRREVFALLNRRRPALQAVLARTLAFKNTPVLAFKPDTRLEAGDRVLELLNRAEKGEEI